MMRIYLSILWLAFAACMAAGQDALTDAAKAVEMVKKLSSRDFAERAAADKELLRIGPTALPALRDGLKAKDAEVQSRCKGLIGRIEDAEWKRKVEAYFADVDGTKLHDLPMLKSYEKMVGTGPPARKLFADCLRTNGVLIQTAAGERSHFFKAYHQRCTEVIATKEKGVFAKIPKIPASDLATLLLVSVALKGLDENSEEQTVDDIFSNAGFVSAMKDRETGETFRRLLVGWAESQGAESFRPKKNLLWLVDKTKFKEGIPIMMRWVQNKDQPKGHLLPMTIWICGKIRGKDVALDLEKLWSDETMVLNGKGKLGDQALAASIDLAGKKPAEYGLVQYMDFTTLPGGEFSVGTTFAGIPVYYCETEADRRAGLKKWRAESAKKK